MDSGRVVYGISRVNAKRIKNVLEACGDQTIAIGEYRKASEKEIIKLANDYGLEPRINSVLSFMQKIPTDILLGI